MKIKTLQKTKKKKKKPIKTLKMNAELYTLLKLNIK